MSSSTNTPDINRLFQNAHDDGMLSTGSLQALDLVDIGTQIQAGLGVSVDDVSAGEVLLVTMMPDDSGSIRYAGNAGAVRDGHNMVLEALAASQQRDQILAHTRFLNGSVLFPYAPLSAAVPLSARNYDPRHGTPLYDQTMILLATVLAKAQEFADNGVPARTVTLIITDGADQHSTFARPQQIALLVDDLLRAEQHIVAAMGVDDGATDFRQVFREMGIRDEWILTPGSSAGEIRRAFQVFSQSAMHVAQGGQVLNLPSP
jgi:hypothetical protein